MLPGETINFSLEDTLCSWPSQFARGKQVSVSLGQVLDEWCTDCYAQALITEPHGSIYTTSPILKLTKVFDDDKKGPMAQMTCIGRGRLEVPSLGPEEIAVTAKISPMIDESLSVSSHGSAKRKLWDGYDACRELAEKVRDAKMEAYHVREFDVASLFLEPSLERVVRERTSGLASAMQNMSNDQLQLCTAADETDLHLLCHALWSLQDGEKRLPALSMYESDRRFLMTRRLLSDWSQQLCAELALYNWAASFADDEHDGSSEAASGPCL